MEKDQERTPPSRFTVDISELGSELAAEITRLDIDAARRLAHAINDGEQLWIIEATTARSGDLWLHSEPSDFFRGFMTALGIDIRKQVRPS